MKNSAPVLIGCKTTVSDRNNQELPVLQAGAAISENRNQAQRFENHWSSSVKMEELAVCVQNLYKSYEDGKPILNNLSMNVKKGTIYGLLGASGCGKSTLLSTIVGLQTWDSGDIYLLNKRVNGVAGHDVGFMPQDIALYDQLSIKEMLRYYSKLYGMSKKDTEQQVNWLIEFLQLPSKFKLVKDLSGGMRRRCSLAITLIHSPSLLILDEPTVGLDPLLRESIWEHLHSMVQTRKQTIIVTTHYIEEARFSNTIGVMRKGRLIVEDSPELLLQQYQCQLLEEVVLKLCHKDEQVSGSSDGGSNNNVSGVVVVGRGNEKFGKNNKGKSSSKNCYNVFEKFQENCWRNSDAFYDGEIKLKKSCKSVSTNPSTAFDRIQAFSTVIWLMFLRHPIFMAMVLFLPTIQMLLTLAVLGTHPKDLNFGVVNYDLPTFDGCFENGILKVIQPLEEETMIGKNSSTCDLSGLSCKLIDSLAKSGTMNLIPIKSEQEGYEKVQEGKLWGYFSFPANYSKHLENFVVEQKFAENDTLEGSRVSLRLDMSHYLGAAMAIRASFEAYEDFTKNMAKSCGIDPREFSLPLLYRAPIFDKEASSDSTYQDYVIPIIVLSVIFEIPMLVTAIIFINDRKQGTMDRARVAGLRFKEIMISHFLTEGSVIIGQAAICSAVMVLTYNFTVKGSYALYFFIAILGGLCGESLGLLLGVIFKDEVEAVIFGIFLGPILLLYEGTLWPIEGMNTVVRTIAYCSPTTLTIESFRSVIYRGVGFLHDFVWPGIAMMSGWTIAFWIVSITIFIRKNK